MSESTGYHYEKFYEQFDDKQFTLDNHELEFFHDVRRKQQMRKQAEDRKLAE